MMLFERVVLLNDYFVCNILIFSYLTFNNTLRESSHIINRRPRQKQQKPLKNNTTGYVFGARVVLMGM